MQPRQMLSRKAVPHALHQAIHHVFAACGKGVWLVGGTALAGFYAEHRRSDDLDLFAASPVAFRAAVLAVQSLKQLGAVFTHENTTSHYYHTLVTFLNHQFTIDCVLDEHLHHMGQAHELAGSVVVASARTLFAMKAAALVSRCSEKDLFDLQWLLDHSPGWTITDLVQAGTQIDGGVTFETLLISLQGATLREEACHFLLPQAALKSRDVYRQLVQFQKQLISLLLEAESKQPLSPAVRAIKQSLKDF